jgi:hypothetical protein
MRDMTRAEQALLQAARAMPQPEPAPAMDAAILNAAAQRAAEVRRQSQQAFPKTSPALERFSRWLLGDGTRRGPFRYALATFLSAGIALGFVLHISRENALAPELSGDVITMQAVAPEAAPAAPEEMLESAPVLAEENVAEIMAERKTADYAASSALNKALPSPAQKADAEMAARRFAIPPPSALATDREARRAESGSPVAAPVAAPMPAARASAPVEEKAHPMEMKAAKAATDTLVKTSDADIDAQLKRILELRRANREEEAGLLLKQLRALYPEANLDERLRQLESESREHK